MRLKRNERARLIFRRDGRNDDGFPFCEDCRCRGRLRIAGAELARRRRFARQQPLGVAGRHPAALLGNANGDDFVFFRVDGLENRSSREQRDLMLAAAAAKKNAYAKFGHKNLLYVESLWRLVTDVAHGVLSLTESSSQTPRRSVPPPGPPCGCVRR